MDKKSLGIDNVIFIEHPTLLIGQTSDIRQKADIEIYIRIENLW